MLDELLDLIFPRTCIACNERPLVAGEQNICTYCRSKLPQTDYHRFPANNTFYEKIAPHVAVRYAFAYLLFTKSGRTQQLLHHLKYKNMPELGEELGRWYGNSLLEEGFQHKIESIIPVPLHSSKLKKRGYNQSYHFAAGLGEAMGLPVLEKAVVRQRPSETQTRKSRLRRWQNVEDIFVVPQPELIEGKHLLLIDDVVTTGATLASCGIALQQAQCQSLSCAALATA